MEIHNQPIQGPRPNRRSQGEPAVDLTLKNRDGIRLVKEAFEAEQYSADSVELSNEGKALAASTSKDVDAKAEKDQLAKVKELRVRYLEGKLNTPERVDRAAQSMLTQD